MEKSKDTKNNNKSQKMVPQTQSQLIWRQFKKHRLAYYSLYILIILYTVGVLFPDFFAPYTKLKDFGDATYMPPQKVRFIDTDGKFHIRPFVYNWKTVTNPETWQIEFQPDTSQRYHIYFFDKGPEYKLMGLFRTNIHFFGVEEDGQIFLFGLDDLGRDVFSRTIYASRISLTVGFVGVFISLFLGLIFGGISGLMGGIVDDLIQRIIETMMSIPKIPLWMALAAAVPKNWSPVTVYFAITIILSLMGWTGLARVIRSKFISLREEDFVSAAQAYNAPTSTIIFRHLVPNFISYIIVNLTLAIPGMIIGETALSFLGIGLRPPVVSLGVLLKRAQNFQTVSMFPWLLIPGAVVVIVVLTFNFVGDGLRDAADPYSK